MKSPRIGENHAVRVIGAGRTRPGIPRSVRYLVRHLACMAGRQVRAVCSRRLIQRPAATQWLGRAGRSELPSVMSGAMHPGDLGGNTAGEVVRQASDDDRDGGNVPGRLATYGQHGVVLAAPGRRVRPGSLRAELPCPLNAGYGLGCRTRTRARPATPGTISGDYALELRTASCMAPAHLSQARGRSRSSSRSSFTVPRRPVNDRCHRGRGRYPHSTSSAGSFVRRLVCHGQHAGVPRP